MTIEETKASIDKISGEINVKLDAATEGIAKGTKATTAVKDELNALVEKHKDANEALTKLQTEQSERLDKFETKLNRVKSGQEEAETFGQKMHKAFTEIKESKGRIQGLFEFEDMDTKAIMLQSTLVNDVIQPDRVRGGFLTPDERNVHLRPYFAQGTTDSNTVDYVEETDYTDGTAGVAEGDAIPQSDLVLTQQTSAVKKVGASSNISIEMLEDVSGLMSYVQGRLVAKYMQREDTQLLAGTGVGVNLLGVSVNAVAWADPGIITNGNAFDVLRAAINQAQVAEYRPNLILVHPDELFLMDTTKDATSGQYLLPYIFNGQQHTISGIPIVATTAIATDNFLVGDFARGAQIFDRRSLSLEVASENADDWQKDLVSVKLTTRLALPIYRQSVFIEGVMSTSITALAT